MMAWRSITPISRNADRLPPSRGGFFSDRRLGAQILLTAAPHSGDVGLTARRVGAVKPKKQQREVRRIRHQSARITLHGVPAAECEIMDISNSGAKIVPDGSLIVPARFELALAHGSRKGCEVIWRRGRMLGVKFTK
jgi:hypothetical protein